MKQHFESIFPDKSEIPEKFQLNKIINQSEYLINGEILQWKGDFEKVFSPIFTKSNNQFDNYIGQYPLHDKATSLKALDAAVSAYDNGVGEWPSMKVEDRISHVKDFVYKMKSQRDLIIKLLMWEIGKTYNDSAKEFDRTVEYIIDTIDELKKLDRKSSKFEIEQGIIAQIRRTPIGVVLCMGPYNYPLNETFTTLIPALIMGNTVIFKPPKHGVLLHYPLLKAFQESFPKGVVNTVYGEGQVVISPLMESGKIDILAFIGSSRVADILKKQHPEPHKLKSILGLEAKNPAIILEDAEIEKTVKECITGALSYNGQRCTALKILFVHNSIKEIFTKRFAEEVDKMKCGMPWEDEVQITPLPEDAKTEFLTELIKDAEKYGGMQINKYGGIFNKSVFFPAVIDNVNRKMRLYHEEQFGPIIPIVGFDDINEPLNYVVESNYGQQASIFGQDREKIAQLIDILVNQVCRVNINSQCQRGPDVFPFTGRKDSAQGTLSVYDALRSFSIRSLVASKSEENNKEIISDIVKNQKSNFLSTDFIF